MEYQLYEILFLFAVYSILGWLAETVIFALPAGAFRNRGVCRGPYVTSFGIGALGVLYAGSYLSQLLTRGSPAFFGGVFAAGFCAGLILLFLSKVVINSLSGRKIVVMKWYYPLLCGLMGLLLYFHINPVVAGLMRRLNPWICLTFLLIFWIKFIADFIDGLWNLRKRK